MQVARSSDGSVYAARFYPVGEDKGKISNVSIDDVSNHCLTNISPFHGTISQDSRGRSFRSSSGLSITLDVAAPPWRSPRVEDIGQNLRGLQNVRWADNPISKTADGEIHRASLGERNVDGMTIFGFHSSETGPDSEEHRVEDRWESDLGFTYSRNVTNPSAPGGHGYSEVVNNLKRAEPNPELFKMQSTYFPPDGTLRNAKTLFISGLPSNRELQQRIESILTASGRFTLLPDRKTADLIVQSDLGILPNSDRNHPPSHEVRLVLHEQNGSDLMWISLRFKSASDGLAELPVVSTCFADLWTQVESQQAPSAPSDEKF